MQIDSFSSAWKQFKLSNAMHHIDSRDILSIIESSESADRTSSQRVLFNVVMFIAIIIVCQGG